MLLSPQIPLLFMGEEWASARPFLFFCDFAPPLAEAVRQGRRREFAQFPEFGEAAAQDRHPRPDRRGKLRGVAARLGRARTANRTRAGWSATAGCWRCGRARSCRGSRGMAPGGRYRVLGPAALRVEWRLGDGSRLLLLANFADAAGAARRAAGRPMTLLYCSAATAAGGGYLPPVAPHSI